MKKRIIGIAVIELVLTMGLSYAFAGDASTPPDNGITVFSSVPAADDAATVTAQGRQLYNGITVFGSSPEAARKASARAAGVSIRADREPYNGITVFDKS